MSQLINELRWAKFSLRAFGGDHLEPACVFAGGVLYVGQRDLGQRGRLGTPQRSDREQRGNHLRWMHRFVHPHRWVPSQLDLTQNWDIEAVHARCAQHYATHHACAWGAVDVVRHVSRL